MKIFYLIGIYLLAVFNSCSFKDKEAQIMMMSGYVGIVPNPKDIRCNKGDTIILIHFGVWGDNKPDETSIYGIYTGKLPVSDFWTEGEVSKANTFEKAVFLRNL